MKKKSLSSGDLIADRRADYARALADARDFAAAADLMRQAFELAPEWAAGWFSQAIYLEKAGDAEAAGEALRAVLRLTEDDIFGAGLKLAVLGQASVPDVPPREFVERLFDDYAERFDHALVERLAYSVPESLAAEIDTARGGDAVFAHAVDLGCGTGLMGERLRERVSYLEGLDLSAGMLAKAREKGIYDKLAVLDLSLSPQMAELPIGNGERADLVTAADVLTYLGDLDTVFDTVAAILAPGGLFAFSVERAPAGCDWLLRPSLRYAHGEAYVRRLAESRDFTVLSAAEAEIRKDGGEAVIGLLFVVGRSARADIADIAAVPSAATVGATRSVPH